MASIVVALIAIGVGAATSTLAALGTVASVVGSTGGGVVTATSVGRTGVGRRSWKDFLQGHEEILKGTNGLIGKTLALASELGLEDAWMGAEDIAKSLFISEHGVASGLG